MSTKKAIFSICDYIDWRGDLTFDLSPFNKVDALILCQLSYINFSNLAPEDFSFSIKLGELSKLFFGSTDFESRSDLGMLIDPKTNELLQMAGSSQRFKNVGITGFRNEYNREIEEQFSATTFILEKNKLFTAFRGTDDTLVGWKEDFNLAFMDKVPAQNDALHYLEAVCSAFKKSEISVGGHSKGGNLAIYASAKLSPKDKKRIESIYNFDGPGFSQTSLDSDDFFSVKQKIKSFFPQFSIIGMLFHHYDSYETVLSSEKFVMQHNPFSWAVKGTEFQEKEELDSGSEIFFKSFNRWFEEISTSQREQFVKTLFGILMITDAKTNSELTKDWLKNAGKILKAFAKLDSEIRDEAVKLAGDFVKTIAKESINL